jgi:GT2 family glycosyltransferase
VEVVVAVDADDRSRQIALGLADVVSYSDEYRGVAGAWNDALALATGDLLVWVGDDTDWGDGWLDAALACEAEHRDWLVGLNDGHTPPDRATHFLMSRRFVRDVLGGVVAWPEYAHSFHDAEICDRAQALGRYVWCGESLVRHVHWLWGDREQDATDQLNLGGHPDSQRNYELRRAAGFPNNYEPVV